MRAESPGDHLFQTTVLVHEAFVRLVSGPEVAWQDRVRFYAVCGRVMRRILIDRARERRSLKRGADEGPLPLDSCLGAVPAHDNDLLALDEALGQLSKLDPRMGQVVDLRFFAGLSVEDTAEALCVSSKTVQRGWQVARNWLLRELKGRAS
jgi:RNA polymerase sigma factor (TIGR02999 family)